MDISFEIKKKAFILFLVVFSFCVFTKSVYALSISPVRFELKGDRGQILTGEILLTNETNTTETFYSSFANFEAQGESGNPAFVLPKEGLGTWIRMEDSVIVNAHSTKNIPFSIKIPENAEPGGHFAVIFFGDARKDNKQSVSIGSQIGVLILLSVSGDVKQAGGLTNFNLKNNKHFFNTLPVDFEYKIKNDGGDRIKPEGDIIIRNMVFYPSAKINANIGEGNILPNSTRRFDVSWIKTSDIKEDLSSNFIFNYFNKVKYEWKNFAFGLYFAKLSITGNIDFGKSKSVLFFVFPWQLLLFLVFLFFIIFFLGKKILNKYNGYIIEKARIDKRL